MARIAELDDLESMVTIADTAVQDGLRLRSVPLVPEISLNLAEDAILLWARLEAEQKHIMENPFWASAWAGGQAIARYVLDQPQTVIGKRVLDLGSGSGLAAIAAAKAGAASVVANDIDPYAIAAISMNALANNVKLEVRLGKIRLDENLQVDVIIAGDALYSPGSAASVLPLLRAARRRGIEILIGDPGRGHLPDGELSLLATYALSRGGAFIDAQIDQVDVFRLV